MKTIEMLTYSRYLTIFTKSNGLVCQNKGLYKIWNAVIKLSTENKGFYMSFCKSVGLSKSDKSAQNINYFSWE